jgi:hypothetical protein
LPIVANNLDAAEQQGKYATPVPPAAPPGLPPGCHPMAGMPAFHVRVRPDLFDEVAAYARNYFANLRGVTGGNFLLVVSIFEEE